MAKAVEKRHQSREVRKRRVRKRIQGTDARPRLCVFRSLKYTYAQLISDESNVVLGAASTKGQGSSTGSVPSAKELGKAIAKVAADKKISKVIFDRNGYVYHGRVAAVAEGAREAGLSF